LREREVVIITCERSERCERRKQEEVRGGKGTHRDKGRSAD
jgi:hypothetical protein